MNCHVPVCLPALSCIGCGWAWCRRYGSTFGKFESQLVALCPALEGLKGRQHNDCIIVEVDQGGLVLLPRTEDA